MNKGIFRKITAAGVALMMLMALAPGMGLAGSAMNIGVTYHSNAPGLQAPRIDTTTTGYYIVRKNPFSNPGYTFDGWNTQADGSGTRYAPGVAIMVNEPLLLFAQWKSAAVDTVTITYKANLGDNQADVTDSITKGSAYALRANPFANPRSHTFIGWNTRANGSGTNYQPGKKLTANGSHTLYAQWRIMPIRFFTITYIANAGDNQEDVIFTFDVNKGYGELMNNPFTRPGCIFTGWNTQANGSGTNYQPGQTLTANMDYTLYAQWRSVDSQTVTITYNGGGLPDVTDTVTKNSYYTIQPYPYLYAAIYTFLGWNTRADGTGTSYLPWQVVIASADLTLYAQFRLV